GRLGANEKQAFEAGSMSNHDIIVIGGSAGATAPLKEILGRLPADLPAAVFVVLHIPARGLGILSTVASAASRLPVIQAESGMVIENGHIYLAAPDHHLLLRDSHIMLGRGPRENMVRPAIDALFRSAALQYGPRVIGVVLSGLLSDAAAGAGGHHRRSLCARRQDRRCLVGSRARGAWNQAPRATGDPPRGGDRSWRARRKRQPLEDCRSRTAHLSELRRGALGAQEGASAALSLPGRPRLYRRCPCQGAGEQGRRSLARGVADHRGTSRA